MKIFEMAEGTKSTDEYRTSTSDRNHNKTLLDRFLKFDRSWFDPRPQIREMSQIVFWKDMFIEAMALGYILIVVILLLNTCNPDYYTPSPLIIGLFAALMIYTTIDGWGPMSGCLLNPAAVLSFYLCGRMSFVRAFFRIVFEFGGAATGAMIGYGLVPDNLKDKVGPLGKSPHLSINQAGAIEGILTFNLILVALSVTTPGKHTVLHTLTIGCSKATGLLAAGSYTGGIQNPAIAMGPSIASKNFTDHFSIYWIGPFIGAVVAAIVYRTVQFINFRAFLLDKFAESHDEEILVTESRESSARMSEPSHPVESSWTSAVRGRTSRF